MKKNTKIFIGAFIVVAAIGFLVISGFSGNMGVHANLAELVENQQAYNGKFVQTEGKLVEESVKWDPMKTELRFSITSEGKELPILWRDVKPDNFSGDVIVMVGGKFKAGEVFEVDTLTTKCPSKYESAKEEIK